MLSCSVRSTAAPTISASSSTISTLFPGAVDRGGVADPLQKGGSPDEGITQKLAAGEDGEHDFQPAGLSEKLLEESLTVADLFGEAIPVVEGHVRIAGTPQIVPGEYDESRKGLSAILSAGHAPQVDDSPCGVAESRRSEYRANAFFAETLGEHQVCGITGGRRGEGVLPEVALHEAAYRSSLDLEVQTQLLRGRQLGIVAIPHPPCQVRRLEAREIREKEVLCIPPQHPESIDDVPEKPVRPDHRLRLGVVDRSLFGEGAQTGVDTRMPERR
jgi:hypothetical protein